jgi:phosphatidate cytidylyltransferase
LKGFVTRLLTGVVFALLVIGSVLWSPWAFFVLMGVFTFIALNEFIRLFPAEPRLRGTLIYFFLGLFDYVLIGLLVMNVVDFSNVLLVFMSFFVLVAAEVLRRPKPSWMQIAAGFTAFIYIVLPFGLMNGLYPLNNANIGFPWILLALFILVWVNDVFAYLIGTVFGKHKLSPVLSPAKTWEGTVGGFVFTLGFAWLFSLFAKNLSPVNWLWLGVIVSTGAIFGDLAESLLKRNAGVKDSGTLFPGHGGVLDRFDAVLFVTPLVFFYLYMI